MTDLHHPWLDSPEAVEAARKACQIPLALLPGLAGPIGADELNSEALVILTECGTAPDNQPRLVCARQGCSEALAEVRRGAKFCSQRCRRQHGMDVLRSRDGQARPRGASATRLGDVPGSHLGSMWEWPEADRGKYATRTIGYALCNWLRGNHNSRETPSSESLADLSVTAPGDEDATPHDYLARWLEARGVMVTGDEAFTELAEAARWAKGAEDAA